VKELIRSLAYRSAVYGGLTRIGRRLGDRSGAFILYGHRVSDDDEGFMQGLAPAWLDQQLAYLTSHYEVISLRNLVDCLSRKSPVPERSVVLTFDDGFRDNYTNAFPLLQKYRVPATIFAVTGAVSDGDLPWSQRLGYLFQNTSAGTFCHALTEGKELSLDTTIDRKLAYQRVKPAISVMPRLEREAVIAEIGRKLDVCAPKDRIMTWEQAREMHASGVEIGAHTVSHPLLAELPLAEAIREIKTSREDLERELGIEEPSFCFPAGSMNAELLALIPQLGFYCTFLPGQGIRLNSTDTVGPYSLARVGLPNAPAAYLEAELDGPFHVLRHLAGRA